MYSKKEELIDFNYKRDLETGEYDVEILLKSTRSETTWELQEGQAYRTSPLHFKYDYIFKITNNRVYYFKIDREQDVQTSLTFAVEADLKKAVKILTKMLDRATVDEDENNLAYNELKRKLHNEEALVILASNEVI